MQRDSGISPWSANLPAVRTSSSLGSTNPSPQLHKHRRMSSLGQSRRRTSDARGAVTRPSCVRPSYLHTFLLTLSPQCCCCPHRSVRFGVFGNAFFVPTKSRQYPWKGGTIGSCGLRSGCQAGRYGCQRQSPEGRKEGCHFQVRSLFKGKACWIPNEDKTKITPPGLSSPILLGQAPLGTFTALA